jgi:hypothetical protein
MGIFLEQFLSEKWEKMNKNLIAKNEEFEDSVGNVMNKKIYMDMARQNLL